MYEQWKLFWYSVYKFSLYISKVLKTIPTRCNNCGLIFPMLYSTCFGWQSHPSSGVHLLYMATGKQEHLVSRYVRSKLVLSVSVVWSCRYSLSCCSASSGPMYPNGLFVSQRTGSHSAGILVPFTNCFVCRWFCVVHDPKPPLHSHNWLSFGKFQDTERFLIHCERHFSSLPPPSGGTWKYSKAPSRKKKLGDILYLLICSFLPCLSWLLRSRVGKSRRDLWITLY